MWIADPELSVESAGIAAAPVPTARRRSRAGGALGWTRERLRTTPGRLILTTIVVVIGVAVFGIVATGAEQSRERAVRSARTDTEPLLLHAVQLYTALSDANATVATGLLGVGGLEPPAARARYFHDLRVATNSLTALTRGANTAGARAAVETIADQLPVYTAYVEAARANSRQGFPIGAAYLRQASALMSTTMLSAAEHLYAAEAFRLGDDYRTGTSTAPLVALALAIAIALIPLLFAQPYVTRISRRIFNLPLLIATVALVGVSVWAFVGMTSEQNDLATAQQKGSDSVEALSAANVLLSRAQGDLSLTLVNRGNDTTDPKDFAVVKRVLTTSDLAPGLASGLASYWAAAERLQRIEGQGQLEAAIDQAPGVAAISQRLSSRLTDQIDAAQARFTHSATHAASALDGLALAIPVIAVLAALLAVLGLRQRINEYR
jgi:hypothetical protein